jgi:hypothetical protein
MNDSDSIPGTQNEAWGFIGTMGEHAPAAWPVAMTKIAAATGEPLESVRAFLDSRHGRHFANDVRNFLGQRLSLDAAIQAAVDRWKGWRVGPRTSRNTGIPRGFNYLMGYVITAAFEDEAAQEALA